MGNKIGTHGLLLTQFCVEPIDFYLLEKKQKTNKTVGNCKHILYKYRSFKNYVSHHFQLTAQCTHETIYLNKCSECVLDNHHPSTYCHCFALALDWQILYIFSC